MYPFLILNPSFSLPSYIAVISITCCICLIWVYIRAKKFQEDVRIALDMSLMIMIGAFLGARLFHVFYEGYDYYSVFPYDAFRFWDGGFVYYGGWIGGFLLSLLFAKVYKLDFMRWADFFAPVLALGYGLGRIACFLNGCCFGDLCELPWALEFTYPGLPVGHRHPTQLYAMGWELLVTLPLLLAIENRKKFTGQIFFAWIFLHGVGRLIMETFRADDRGQFILNLSVSSWISLAFIFISAGAIYFSRDGVPKN